MFAEFLGQPLVTGHSLDKLATIVTCCSAGVGAILHEPRPYPQFLLGPEFVARLVLAQSLCQRLCKNGLVLVLQDADFGGCGVFGRQRVGGGIFCIPNGAGTGDGSAVFFFGSFAGVASG